MPSSPKKPEESAVHLQPRNAKQFVRLWKIPGHDKLEKDKEDHIINGNADFPNIYSRQTRLVGQVIDACIVLHVYEQIKNNASYSSLKPLFLNNFSEDEFKKIKNLPDYKKAEGGSELLNALIKMSQGKNKKIKTHYDMISKKEWLAYTKEATQYQHDYEEFNKQRNKIKRILQNSDPNNYSEPSSEETLSIRLKRPSKPIDPRVEIANNEIGQTIAILNSGSKSMESIEAKKTNKNNTDITSFRDLNRICVLPTETEYAADFTTIIAKLNPPKLGADPDKPSGKILTPRFFEEQAEIFDHGYYNKKLFVALDRRKDRSAGVTVGNVASIAEIKIIPARMLEADILTAAIKPMRDMLSKPSKYISSNTEDRTPVMNRGDLEEAYNEKNEAFTALLKKLISEKKLAPDVDYKFPKLDLKKPNDPKTYTKLRNSFTELASRIHVDAIKKENDGWQKEYLRTALLQKLASKKQFRDKINEKLPTDITEMHPPGNKWVQEVADSRAISIPLMKAELEDEFALRVKSSRQQPQSSPQR